MGEETKKEEKTIVEKAQEQMLAKREQQYKDSIQSKLSSMNEYVSRLNKLSEEIKQLEEDFKSGKDIEGSEKCTGGVRWITDNVYPLYCTADSGR